MSSIIDTDIFSAGIKFNRVTGEVSVPGAEPADTFRLSPVNRRVLDALINAQGSAVSRTELFNQVWPNQEVSDDALTRSISDLRAQLKPLTNTSPLINTIPKVGYRWLPNIETLVKSNQPKDNIKQRLTPLLFAFVLLLVMVLVIFYFLTTSSQKIGTNVIILPTQNDGENDGGLNVAACLKQATHNNETILYLSDHALNAHNGNPYPYFAHEFGVRWFIESTVKPFDLTQQLNLNLIDARTGLVTLSKTYHVMNSAELSNHCLSFIDNLTVGD